MKPFTIAIGVLALCLSGCCTGHPNARGFLTDYKPDGIYTLQRPAKMVWTGDWVLFPSAENPRYFLDPDLNLWKHGRGIEIPSGTRIQFRKIIYHCHIEAGEIYEPTGVIMDGRYKGTPVLLQFISKPRTTEELPYKFQETQVNPDYLKEELQ